MIQAAADIARSTAWRAMVRMGVETRRRKQPSDADVKITEKLKKAAALVEIKLLDHVIIADKSYFSFADEGLIF